MSSASGAISAALLKLPLPRSVADIVPLVAQGIHVTEQLIGDADGGVKKQALLDGLSLVVDQLPIDKELKEQIGGAIKVLGPVLIDESIRIWKGVYDFGAKVYDEAEERKCGGCFGSKKQPHQVVPVLPQIKRAA